MGHQRVPMDFHAIAPGKINDAVRLAEIERVFLRMYVRPHLLAFRDEEVELSGHCPGVVRLVQGVANRTVPIAGDDRYRRPNLEPACVRSFPKCAGSFETSR